MLTLENAPPMLPRNVESVSTMVPYGTKARLKRAATASGLSLPEYLRRVVTAPVVPAFSAPAMPKAATPASGGVMFAVERFSAIRHELMPLWQAHYDEIAEDKGAIPLDPDWPKYLHFDAGGFLVIITARKAGALIGYAFAVLDTHLHYRSTLFAMLDLYYLKPEHRGGRTALRLFEALEAALVARGVVKVAGNTKLAHDQGRIFHHLGWREAERLYVKLLGAA